ncbi:MAG TPA: nuclear transport factor 2 family protein [Gemmatimonadales bacterium]|nr:nuclear transport factor 2 family protein [Gemmatimonadales bacterium]
MGPCRGHPGHPSRKPRAARPPGDAPTVRLSGRRLAVLLIAVLAGTGCRIEDRTPTGTRRDEDTVHQLLGRYARGLSRRDWAGVRSLFWQDGTYSGPIGPGAPTGYHQAVSIDAALRILDHWLQGVAPGNFDVRILRTDFRQQGDLAAAWVVTRRRTPSGPGSAERDWVEHVVLRRIDGDWRILSVAVVSSPRGGAR